MRLGVIARSEDRGLGVLTLEVCRHLNPERVLLVDMGSLTGHFETHPERFDRWDTHTVPWEQMGDPAVVGPLIDGLDVVYFAETPYRWEFCDIARSLKVATVCHMMPEFFPHIEDPSLPRPSAWWLPSQWLRNDPRLPRDTTYMPVPCPTDRWDSLPEHWNGDRPLRILHVGGHQAMADRNGTRSLLAALRHVTRPVNVTVTSQDRHLPSPQRLPSNVVYCTTGVRGNYWDLYRGYDVAIQPRRYGGLSLPIIEAAGAGLAIIMTDVSPNHNYPVLRVAAPPSASITTKLGSIPTVTADPKALAEMIDALADSPTLVADWQRIAQDYAKDMAWSQWADVWLSKLDEVKP